jgi:hypothetical protein
MSIRLATELILEILEQFTTEGHSDCIEANWYAMLSVSLTCCRLNHLIASMIYGCQSSKAQSRLRMYGDYFLRTLVRNPELAALVQRFDTRGSLYLLYRLPKEDRPSSPTRF